MITHKTVKRSLLALSMAASIYIIPDGAMASGGLQAQMDKLFNEMSNTTDPGIYESQRRGALAGGRYTVKTRIFDEPLVSFSPPSWKAGCGGVDLYGGSLSFINADQIVQLLRSVAANAKGYAFQLALDNVFPDGAKWIENFQKKVQALNQHLGNSCQLAQGIVNDLSSGYDSKYKTDASITATTKGLYEDFFAANTEKDGKTPAKSIKDNDPDTYKDMTGNIVWKQLKQNNASSWFVYGDESLLEAIMSVTGAIVIGDLVGESGNETSPIVTLPKILSLSDLVNGGTIKSYSCDGDTEGCSSPTMTTITIDGARNQISDILLGTTSSPGVINKYVMNVAPNDQEKAFLSNLPSGAGGMIRTLSALSPDTARRFAEDVSDSIAVAMMYDVTEEFFKASLLALSNSDSAYAKPTEELLLSSREQIKVELESLTSVYGKISDITERYSRIIEVTEKQKYSLTYNKVRN